MKIGQFLGYGETPGEAINDAMPHFDEWYSKQQIRFVDNGGSFFQVSASLSHAAYRDGKVEYIYCITVFDPRD